MIADDQAYCAALKRIDELMDIKPGDPDEAEFDLLVAEVVEYENKEFGEMR